MKITQHPVPDNFCIYIFLFTFCQLNFVCPCNPSLHSYKWPSVFGAPEAFSPSNLHSLTLPTLLFTCWCGFQKHRLRRSVTIHCEIAHRPLSCSFFWIMSVLQNQCSIVGSLIQHFITKFGFTHRIQTLLYHWSVISRTPGRDVLCCCTGPSPVYRRSAFLVGLLNPSLLSWSNNPISINETPLLSFFKTSGYQESWPHLSQVAGHVDI